MRPALLRRFFQHGMLVQLLVFETVARLGSVTRAAAELHLAQPTVSMQLRKLAEALELRLFEQRGRGLALTPAGRALHESCADLIESLARMEGRLAALRGPASEVLRLAAEPEARPVAARLIAAFCARHPGVQVSLHLADRAQLLLRLAAAEDDVYLFELEIEGLPLERRWSVAHAKGRALALAAAAFVRESLLHDAYNSGAQEEEDRWNSRANTTRR